MAASPGSHPFTSKSQWRLFFARPNLKRWAHQKAHATQRARGGVKVAYRSLPGYSSMAGRLGVGKATRGTLRVKNRRRGR